MIRQLALFTITAVAAVAANGPLLSFIPPDAKVIGGIHVDRTLNSVFGRFVVSQMNDNSSEFHKFIDATGFDPRMHLREMVFASSDTNRKSGVVIARGVFNGPQIANFARSHGGTATNYKGIDVISGKHGQSIAVFDGDTAVVGEERFVRYAIDQRGGRGTAATAAIFAKAATLQSQFDGWVVAAGVFTPGLPGTKTPAPPAAALAGIEETSGGVQFGSVVRVTGEALTRSPKDAQALVDVMRFVVGMAQGTASSNPDAKLLEPLFTSLNLTTDASTVRLTMAIQEADLEALINAKKRIPAQRASR